MSLTHIDIEQIFNSEFADYCTTLIGGADEPFYQVCDDEYRIHYRADYVSSALHEIAHWCIAGRARRLLNDYGYWYEADRDHSAQKRFFQVEIKPQALEWVFADAAEVPFQCSVDSFADIPAAWIEEFKISVESQKKKYLKNGLSSRAARFRNVLRFNTRPRSVHHIQTVY